MSNHTGKGMHRSGTHFGKFIRARRLKLGKNQNEIAQAVGISQNQLSAYEIWKKPKMKDEDVIYRLAAALDCDVVLLVRFLPPLPKPETKLAQFAQRRKLELGLTIGQLRERLNAEPNEIQKLLKDQKFIMPNSLAKFVRAFETESTVVKTFVFRFPPTPEVRSRGRLSRFIRKRRKALGLTQDDVRKELGCTRQAVSSLETRKHITLSGGLSERLSKVLKVEQEELLKRSCPQKPGRRRKRGTLGYYLTRRRQAKHMTLEALSKLVGKKMPYLSELEQNKVIPEAEFLKTMSKILECTIPKHLLLQK